ncbi:MAG TPA: hypothetical protein ENJ90_10075 [Devosia sp.]|nr:hypothetical protein [Devosia sp.]
MRWKVVLLVFLTLVSSSPAVAQQRPPIPEPRIIRPGDTAPDTGMEGSNTGMGGPMMEVDPEQAARISQAIEAVSPAITGAEYSVTLSASIVENGPIIPEGLVWRVFDTRTDETGQLALIYKSEDAVASLSLPLGEYLVHVAYGRSQASDPLTVERGPNMKTVALQAGALRLKSAITGDIAIPSSQLRFDIFTAGLDEGRVPVALDVEENAMIHLNAGTYSVVSKWGNVNATVRADLRVEPSQVTEATLFHRAAQITFKLASVSGGEAIADVDWTVTNQAGDTLFTALGAFPVVVLAEGDYTVIAQSGERVFNRDFQVQPGAPREIEVLTTVY